MPKLIYSPPKYRKHRASGQAIVTLNGRDHYLGPHGTKASKREYDRLVSEWLASGRSTSFGATQHDLTLVELVADYLSHARAHYGTGPKSEYFRMVRVARALKNQYGRHLASEFGVVQFKVVRQQLIDEGCSRSYTNATMQRVVRVFRWAAAEGRVPIVVPQTLALIPGLRRGKCNVRETTPVLPVDYQTIEATLLYLPEVVADMVRFQRFTGCRPAEVCLLRPSDIDRSGEVWLYRPKRHKTQHHGRDRVVLIGPKAQGVLLRYLARDAKAFCFRPCDSMDKHRAARRSARKTPLSCGNKPGSNRRKRPRKTPGEVYAVDAYRRAIARACDKAFPHPTLAGCSRRKFPLEQTIELRKWQHDHRWAPNQLRHAAATEVRRHFGLEAAQVILGHSQANVTQVYAERDMAKGVEVARAIG